VGAQVIQSTDSGQTWVAKTYPAPASSANAIWGSSPTDFYITSYSTNGVYHTTNGGVSYTTESTAFFGGLWCVKGSSATNVWVGGLGFVGHFDGTSWNKYNLPDRWIFAVEPIPETNTVWIGGRHLGTNTPYSAIMTPTGPTIEPAVPAGFLRLEAFCRHGTTIYATGPLTTGPTGPMRILKWNSALGVWEDDIVPASVTMGVNGHSMSMNPNTGHGIAMGYNGTVLMRIPG
jgi:hypothetical protein